MKILLFGGAGQLGLEIQKRAEDLNFEVVSPVISEVDISDLPQVERLTKKVKPALIMNCAAYTNVDKAESEEKLCFDINAVGAGNVAQVARENKARLLHVSTDFVFDGKLARALKEDDAVNPLSVYGKSKLEGEKLVSAKYSSGSLIVRTSSLHGAKGHNFVHIMLKLFKEKDLIKVVSDRIMSPTWAGWLAECMLDLGRMQTTGIVHASCSGAISWFEFASKTLELVKEAVPNAQRVRLEPISSSEYPAPAARPEYSAFDCSRLESVLGRKPINWIDGLKAHLRDLEFEV